MQFLLIPVNGPPEFQSWEDDYRARAGLDRIARAAAHTLADRSALAAEGEIAFRRVCADCHGTYGAGRAYPEKMVELSVIGTDRCAIGRWASMAAASIPRVGLSAKPAAPTIVEPAGYVAPPLDGIWASAPYLHNGSVPTLWHLFHPDTRPVVWKRTPDGYDQQRVGLEVATFDRFPDGVRSAAKRRRIFDTRLFGKSAAGQFVSRRTQRGRKAGCA